MAKFTKTLTLICAASALVLSANTASATFLTFEQCKQRYLNQANNANNTLMRRASSSSSAKQLASYYPRETYRMYISFYTSKSSVISVVRQHIHARMKSGISRCKR